jgi:hypothetical protein
LGVEQVLIEQAGLLSHSFVLYWQWHPEPQ